MKKDYHFKVKNSSVIGIHREKRRGLGFGQLVVFFVARDDLVEADRDP